MTSPNQNIGGDVSPASPAGLTPVANDVSYESSLMPLLRVTFNGCSSCINAAAATWVGSVQWFIFNGDALQSRAGRAAGAFDRRRVCSMDATPLSNVTGRLCCSGLSSQSISRSVTNHDSSTSLYVITHARLPDVSISQPDNVIVTVLFHHKHTRDSNKTHEQKIGDTLIGF